ncbi:GntR family transcriptional regulator [Caldibacillus sp. 210928-DFI.2.22]|uniref:GntR family transcriptional regulator n=1 Tax=unclassified Caldibacillus TaxID=2641266 RepID=UPI001D063515|nr:MULTISPECIES: GntR family transcriptional regulator [unclassified Caldibacillus]MCB7069779.1 GntR family transcriptional regulator [Caldibacillus sp. 210928-DFI.2.22]MCB7073246.1 GntR family transcriptional regulator [Caldibacillus sp. 210928-DFI.2.18]
MVKNWIKSKVFDGTFQPNQKISSESELMKQFNVSRHTVRLALADLVNEGLLYKEQGSGTYVSERSLKKNQTNSVSSKKVAIITTYISDYIFPSIIRGAESVLSQEGYQVTLFSTNNNHESEKRILETVISQNFDGVIVEPTKSAISNPNINYYLNLEALKIPYIMINAFYDELEPISVTLNDMEGGYLQTEHLIRLGHRNILGFFKNDDMQGLKRMKGYLKAYRDYGIPIIPQNIITYNTKSKDSALPLERLEDRLSNSPEKITGIVSYNDELAMRILEVLRQKNLQIPEDISIVGFDDSFLSEVSEVKLTTIKHPKSELGEMAAKLIISLIEINNGPKSTDSTAESYVFEPSLVIRNSTKKINEFVCSK